MENNQPPKLEVGKIYERIYPDDSYRVAYFRVTKISGQNIFYKGDYFFLNLGAHKDSNLEIGFERNVLIDVEPCASVYFYENPVPPEVWNLHLNFAVQYLLQSKV